MPYASCIERCGQKPIEFTGTAIDWLNSTTADQQRIETVLALKISTDDVLLHVGVGNSKLAQRFHERVSWIEGITLGGTEGQLAKSFGIPNYNVHRINKYDETLTSRMQHLPYNFIIDNNPASYACCVYHFHTMMRNYVAMLGAGGKILTDKAGLSHVGLSNDPNWDLIDDLDRIAKRFDLTLIAETDFVYSLGVA